MNNAIDCITILIVGLNDTHVDTVKQYEVCLDNLVQK